MGEKPTFKLRDKRIRLNLNLLENPSLHFFPFTFEIQENLRMKIKSEYSFRVQVFKYQSK